MSQVASKLSDAELVRQTLGGQPESFSSLIERYERLVTAIVHRTSGHPAETDDLVQDVFLDAFRRLSSLRDPERFRGWLAQLASNRAHSWGRRRRVERAAYPRLAREGEHQDPDTSELDENKQRLAEALERLSPEAHVVVTLRYLEGLSAPEIAKEVGINPAAVRQRLSRALRTLRRDLGVEEGS